MNHFGGGVRLCALLVFLCACGGSASGPELAGEDEPTTLTGTFGATPVAGVSYRTETQTGVTGPEGEFLYLAGETVAFSLGAMKLGPAVDAAERITEADLVPGVVVPESRAEVEQFFRDYERNAHTEVAQRQRRLLKLLSLLHSLDGDKDDSNGIVIAEGVASLVTEPIDLDGPLPIEIRRPREDWELVDPFRLARTMDRFGRYVEEPAEMDFAWAYDVDYYRREVWEREPDRYDEARHEMEQEFYSGDLRSALGRPEYTSRTRDAYVRLRDDRYEDPAVHRLLLEVGAALLVDDARQVHPLIALDRYCAALGLAPRIEMTTEQRWRNELEPLLERVESRLVDARGWLGGYASDLNGDGFGDQVMVLERDRFGGVVRTDYDRNGDLQPDRTVSMTRDESGNVTSWVREGESSESVFVVFDEHGRRVREDVVGKDGFSSLFGFELRASLRYTYDDEGRPVRMEKFEIDKEMLRPRFALDYAYDADGRVIRVDQTEYDRTDSTHYTYDEWGNRTATLREYNGRGELSGERKTFDESGNLLRLERVSGDEIYHRETNVYDSDGRLVRREIDRSADGDVDESTQILRDADGRPVRREEIRRGDELERVWTFFYDAEGREVRRELSFGEDGRIQDVMTFAYDADGRLVKGTLDEDGDGTPEHSFASRETRVSFFGYSQRPRR
ncbi:MAG: hypothetical protein AAGD14_19030 [Planctomycetota bacterium]